MATTGKKVKKTKKTIPLNEFLSDGGAPIPTGFTIKHNWADEMEEKEDLPYKPSKDNVVLPTAPKAARSANVDTSRIPPNGPFKLHIGNIPYETTQDEISGVFKDFNLMNVQLPKDDTGSRLRGFGYAEFRDLTSLLEALQLDGYSLNNRSLRLQLPGEMEDGKGGRRDDREDRTSNDWRAGREAPAPRRDDNFSRRENGRGFEERGEPARSDGAWQPRGGFSDRSGNNFQERGGFDRNDRRGGGGFDRNERGGDRGGFDRSDRGGDRSGFDRNDRSGFDRNDRGFSRGRDNDFNRGSDERSNDRGFERRDDQRQNTGYGRGGFERRDEGYGDRRNVEDRPARREYNSSNRDFEKRTPAAAEGESSPPRAREGPTERPKLNLKPRTKPLDQPKEATTSAIFGGAKPVDTTKKEQEIEAKIHNTFKGTDDEPAAERVRRFSQNSSTSNTGRSRKVSETSNRDEERPRGDRGGERRHFDRDRGYDRDRDNDRSGNRSMNNRPPRNQGQSGRGGGGYGGNRNDDRQFSRRGDYGRYDNNERRGNDRGDRGGFRDRPNNNRNRDNGDRPRGDNDRDRRDERPKFVNTARIDSDRRDDKPPEPITTNKYLLLEKEGVDDIEGYVD